MRQKEIDTFSRSQTPFFIIINNNKTRSTVQLFLKKLNDQ